MKLSKFCRSIFSPVHFLVRLAFSFVWRKYLYDSFTGRQAKVIKIRGWRSALVDEPTGQRKSVTFCPLGLK